MGQWITVGTVSPTLTDWQLIGTPISYGVGADVSLFRFSHNWINNLSPYGKCWMAGWFPGNHLALFNPLYPDKNNSRLIYSPVPVGYQQAGYLSRTIAIKADSRCRIYEGSNWQITVEYFQPDADTQSPELAAITEIDQSVDQLAQEVEQLTDSLFPDP